MVIPIAKNISPPVGVVVFCSVLLFIAAAVNHQWFSLMQFEIGDATPHALAPPNDQEWRDAQALLVQRELAFWAKAAFWLSTVTTTVTAIGIYFVARTLHHNSQQAHAAAVQAEMARKEFAYAEKPVLRIQVLSDNIEDATDPERFVEPSVKFKITNVGRGIAFFDECPIALLIADRTPVPTPEVQPGAYWQTFDDLAVGNQVVAQHDGAMRFTLEH
ncbi:MAG: hypothetical protein ABL932_18870, partial [Terricaulis sp.]